MQKNHFLRRSSFLGILLLAVSFMFAETVKFPSLTEPGNAQLTEQAGQWVFSNNIFTISYKVENSQLVFEGSPELSIEGGTELFQIELGNGTKVNASQMEWIDISSESLVGNIGAAKFSKRLNGEALIAKLKYNNLDLIWRAVLRDGSHYLRTELEISTSVNTPMTSITPMLYKINNEGKSAPVVVGNTRGAVIASEHIFAGVETPLAFNMVTGSFNPNFKVKSWTPDSWLEMTESVPANILNLGFNPSNILVSKGDVNVSTAGTWTFTFQYNSGPNRMNTIGVDILNASGNVVAADYHIGYTGNAAANNSYSFEIPEAGDYTLRYFIESKSEPITSSGNIQVSKSGGSTSTYNPNAWIIADWSATSSVVPSSIENLGFEPIEIASIAGDVNISAAGNLAVKFQYQSGNHRLNLVGVDILDDSQTVVASDYHLGFTGSASENNTYTINVPAAGNYTLRYFAEIKTESIHSSGAVSFTGATVKTTTATDEITALENSTKDPYTDIIGKWSRKTTLRTTDTFRVSTVIGIVAPGQQRRSFLAYHERERVVPWRSFIHYNSWYELNIDRNNDSNPLNRMSEQQCLPVIEAWKTKLYEPYGLSIDAFVWDDGWDDFNSLWDFHIGFPNGFDKLDQKVAEQGAGTGTWLGPVGGYGSSKAQRLSYWNKTYNQNIGNFELSNQIYFDAFVNRCGQMVDDYDMRYFKFDGISDFFSATGPKNEEDAEGFINMVNALRDKREDLYINATVGTWASPFWFQVADAVWRQENDFGQAGDQGDSREKWITYRDRLVHQNFVSNSPLAPINSIMTHGLMVTKYGPPNIMPRNNSATAYKGIVKEMRLAFASGSSLVELYLDNDLMTSIGNGRLWGDLAECITWHRENKDVFADTHWIGGNPWDGSEANVYGWAAWNGEKSMLTLRNPSNSTKNFTTTLRDAFDIPDYIGGKIILTHAFESLNTNFPGIIGEAIDIDDELNFELPAFEVVVLNGIDSEVSSSVNKPSITNDNSVIYGEIRKIIFKNISEGAKVQIVDLKGSIISNTYAFANDFTITIPTSGVYVVNMLSKEGVRKAEKVIVL